ncbi:MAG TPA: hypothetical protein VMT68_19900 [Caulobacteraceae bacterium]|nr:hypothetical protein [Caulobacteraceae bacterium]
MAISHLTPISDSANDPTKGGVVDLGRGADPVAWRMRQLQFEARSLAREQIEGLARDLGAMATRAAEIASGGESYPVGAREVAARLAEDLPRKAQLLLTLVRREE